MLRRRVHIALLHIYKVLEEAKLIHGIKQLKVFSLGSGGEDWGQWRGMGTFWILIGIEVT